MKTISFIIFFLLYKTLLFGQIFKLEDVTKPTEFGKSMSVYEDKGNNLTLEQVSNSNFQNKFTPQSANQFQKFGYSKSAFWLRFQLENKTKETNWVLDIAYSYLDNIKIYHKRRSNASWKQYFVGENYPFSSRLLQFRQFDIPLRLEQNEANEFFVKIEPGNPLIVPMFLYPQTEFYEFVMIDQLYYGIFIGVIFIMMLSNLFVYWNLREKNYLFYVSQLLLTLVLILMMTGNLNKYILKDVSGWQNTTFLVLLMMTLFATNAYAVFFLNIKKHSLFAYKIFMMFAAIIIAVFLSLFLLSYEVAISIIQLLIFFNMCFYVVAGILAYRKGNRSAKFYFVAYIIYLIGVSIVIGRDLGLLPFTFLTTHAAEIGILCETLFLSFALSDKYRIERQISLEDKEKAQMELIKMQIQANTTLEAKVKIRTFELQEKQDEILAQNKELYQQREEIAEQKNIIEVKNHNIVSSITYAKRIQTAILPEKHTFVEHFVEYFVFYQPKDIVSGDFYWVLEHEDLVFFAVADCTGHGVPGALMSMLAKGMLDNIVLYKNIYEPSQILTELNNAIIYALKQSTTGARDGLDCSLCMWDKNTRKLKISGAHHTVLHIHNNEMQSLKTTNKGIGGVSMQDNENIFNTYELEIQENTSLYLFSDGFQDQFGGEQMRKFSSKKLHSLLEANHQLPMQNQQKLLENTITTWMEAGKQKQIDDITVMGIRL